MYLMQVETGANKNKLSADHVIWHVQLPALGNAITTRTSRAFSAVCMVVDVLIVKHSKANGLYHTSDTSGFLVPVKFMKQDVHHDPSERNIVDLRKSEVNYCHYSSLY